MTRRALPVGRLFPSACLLALAACSPSAQTPAKPVVIVSVVPQAFVVEKLAGDAVDVRVMIPPGASPATYEPTLSQIKAVADATLYVKVGHPHFPFEATWLDRLLRASDGADVVDASAGVAIQKDEDPHLWTSPSNMRTMATNVADALAEVLPAEEPRVRANLEKLLDEIDAVDADLRELLADAKGGKFFVFHPAWCYLADEYGLVQVAVEHHGKEPDAHTVSELINEAKDAGVDVIFVQPQFNRASADLVAEEIGARVEVIDPLARDWSENLRNVARKLAEAARP